MTALLNPEPGAIATALTPLTLSWTDLGGPARACLQVEGLDMNEWRALLGKALTIYDENGLPCWWGYAEEVRQGLGKQTLICTMAEMANRVALRYRSFDAPPDNNFVLSPWAEDPHSIALYGVKEKIFTAGLMSEASALQMRDLHLRHGAIPPIRLSIKHEARQGCFLYASGWFRQLSHRIATPNWPVLEHARPFQGMQTLGEVPANSRIAQSFVAPANLRISAIAVRARRIGNPSGALLLSLHKDENGHPAADPMARTSMQMQNLPDDTYPWLQVALSEPIALEEKQTYWLVLSRDSPNQLQACLQISVDESLGATGGKLRIYNQNSTIWQPRIPEADLLYRLTCVQSSAEQISEILITGGQAFSGFSIDVESELLFSPLQHNAENCLQALLRVLAMGTERLRPLLANVSAEGHLHIYEQPSTQDHPLRLNERGQLCDSSAYPLPRPQEAIGRAVNSDKRAVCYLRKIERDCLSGTYRLNS